MIDYILIVCGYMFVCGYMSIQGKHICRCNIWRRIAIRGRILSNSNTHVVKRNQSPVASISGILAGVYDKLGLYNIFIKKPSRRCLWMIKKGILNYRRLKRSLTLLT